MKIGIFTQPLKSNYGGILQNYAMQVVLKRLGHEPWTVDYLRFTWWDWFVVVAKVTILKCLGRRSNYLLTPTKVQRQENPLRRFALKYIQLTQPRVKYPSKSILQSYGFDALLVGSDQTWRPMYNGKIYDMYLQLAEGMDVKRVAYAASLGTDLWEYTPEQETECARLAKQFDAISVREASGVGLCKEHFDVEATHVLDPTLLLTANDYNELCKDLEPREPFVFAYILDMTEQKVAEIKAFAEARGEYETMLKEKQAKYKGIEGADPEGEVMADLLGKYVFEGRDFIMELATKDRNAFQKLWDGVTREGSSPWAGYIEKLQVRMTAVWILRG